MKSLKRTLSRVLVLAMVLGLFGGLSMPSAASNYTDDKDIQYKEAVDVMSAVGAINGRLDGTFDPKNTINRAEAAKMVTYTVLGKESAEALPAGVNSSFSDISAEFSYAASSIEYLVKEGVINGMGDGTFHPGEPISGYAVLKMLLCALGYGAKGEYTGAGWDLKVAIDASKYGLLEDRIKGSSQLSVNASREEVALYCLNTIQKPEVTYVSALDIYDDGSVLGGTTTSMLGTVYGGELQGWKAINTRSGNAGHADNLGRPANYWKYKGEDVGEYPIKAARTYTAEQTSVSKLAADLKGLSLPSGSYYDPITNTSYGISFDVTVNGEIRQDDVSGPKDASALAGIIAPITGNSVAVSVYARESGRVIAVTAVQTDIAQISAINPVSGDVTIELTGEGHVGDASLYTISKTNDLYDKVSSHAEGDRILVTLVKVGDSYIIGSVAEPTKVTGKVSISTVNGTYTIDGKSYGIAKGRTAAAASMTIDPSASDEWDVWVDGNGYIIDAKKVTPDAGSKIVFVLDTFQKVAGESVVNMAKVVRTSGEVEDLAYTTSGGGATPSAMHTYTVEFNASKNAYVFTTKAALDPDSGGTHNQAAAQAPKDSVITLQTGQRIAKNDKQLTIDITKKSTNGYENFYSSGVKFIYINTTGAVTVHTGVEAVTLKANNFAVTEEVGGKSIVTAVFFYDTMPDGQVDTTKLAYSPLAAPVAKQVMEQTNKTSVTVPVYNLYIGTDKTAVQTPVTAIQDSTGATAAMEDGHYYQMMDDPATPNAYILREFIGATGDTMAVIAVDGNKVDGATEKSSTLVKINTNNDGTASENDAGGHAIEYIEFKDAVVVDTRTEKAQEDQAINTSSAAKFFGNLTEYGSLTFGFVYDKTTGNASVIYVQSVGPKNVPVSIKADPNSTQTITDKGSGKFEVGTGNLAVTYQISKVRAYPGAPLTLKATLVSKGSGFTGSAAHKLQITIQNTTNSAAPVSIAVQADTDDTNFSLAATGELTVKNAATAGATADIIPSGNLADTVKDITVLVGVNTITAP